MPFRIGVIAYPAFIVALQLGKPSATGAFERAGAFSPETSRRPQSLEVPMKALRRATKKKLLVPVGDGRYYLDRAALKRADRKTMIIMLATLVSFAPLVWLMW